MNFFADNLRVSKILFFPIFVLLVLYTNLDQYLTSKLETSMRSVTGMQDSVYLYGTLSMSFNLLVPLLLLILCLFVLNYTLGNQKTTNFEKFFKNHFSQLVIETLRTWGQILLWSLLFILPGVWKFIQLLLVPFVVTLDNQYEQGKIDALKRSSQIVKRHWISVVLFLIVFNLFIPMVLTSFFSAYRDIWETPLASLTLSALDTYIFILSTQILYTIFIKEGATHDAYV